MKRFLFAISLMALAAASTAGAATVVVHPGDLSSGSPCSPGTCTYAYTHPVWFFYNDETDVLDNTLGSFVVGPGTPLTGRGGAQISVTGTQRRNLATYQFAGTTLASITTLKFTTYNPSAGNGGGASRSAYLNFNVDLTGSNTFQGRLSYVPNVNATVVQDSWKEWDCISGGNALWLYPNRTWPAPLSGSGNIAKTWNQILAAYPSARILSSDPWLGLRVGEPYSNGYTEDIDNFTLNGTVFDFEPGPYNVIAPVAPTACITPANPTASIPVNIARTDAVGARGYSVTLQLSANLALNSGVSSITEGNYLSSVGGTTFHVVDNGGGSYTVDCAILSATSGATAASGNLFNLVVKKNGADGPASVTITSTTLRDVNNVALFSDPGAPATMTIDYASPTSISGLAAVQQRTGNPAGQTTKINLSWPAPEAGATVEVFRKGFGNYPEYDDGASPGSVPGAPGSYPPAGWSLVASVPSGTTTFSDFAETENINFEPPTYTLGSINGQDGWSRAGSYDHNVDGSFGYGTFGTQSLRISNATTSGSFDQTYAKPLVNGVGESSATAGVFSVGTRRGQFEVQFDIASVPGTTAGMSFSMSPDRGDGSRMSYLRFEDNGGGNFDVFFDDVQGTTNPANFVETPIGSYSKASPHHIRLSMTTIDGPSNDVVKVYIDGVLQITGTSWENYYRYDSEASGEQSTRIVKTVIFRTGGPAQPANSGKGFLVDNFSLTSQSDMLSRDFLYYAAYVRDACGNYSAASNVTSGTLNYHLGDVSDGVTPGTGNNQVFTEDLTLLGNHYGITLGEPDTYGMLDFGPTTTGYIDGRPLTDNKVNFEDLILLAINYNVVSAPSRINAGGLLAAERNDVAVQAPAKVAAGETFTATLHLEGAGELHGISSQLGWDASVATPVSVAAGELATAQGAMVLSSAPGNVDAATLGTGQGFLGKGTLATVTFRALKAGDPQVKLASVDARDGRNQKVALVGAPAPLAPQVTAFALARPNPFNHATTLSFTLAKAGAVELTVFSVDGRKVTTLVNESRAAGAYQVSWNGLTHNGQPARPGLYFARLTTAEGRFSRTLVLTQ